MAEIGVSDRWPMRHGILLFIYILQICEAKSLHYMTIGQQLEVSDTLKSQGGYYELGFFSPAPHSSKLYLGIWFTKAKTKAVVWVSNREHPFTTASPVLIFEEDGNLATLDLNTSYKVTNATTKGKDTRVFLLDSGNLVLQDMNNSKVLWESFDYPTDTLLAGMKLGYDKTKGKLWAPKSWKTPTDPSLGPLRFSLHPSGSNWAVIERHIRGTDFAYGTFWYGDKMNTTWSMIVENHQVNYTYSMPTEDYATLTFNINATDFFIRYKVVNTGQIKVLIWGEGYPDWLQLFSFPNRECDFYAFCGKYSICDQDSSRNPCSCLPGFDQVVPENWENENYSDGCERVTSLTCGSSTHGGTIYDFAEVTGVSLPIMSKILFGFTSEEECRNVCKNNCSCNGYSYKNSRCAIFDAEITNVQRLPSGDESKGESIFIKVASSDLINPQGKHTFHSVYSASRKYTIPSQSKCDKSAHKNVQRYALIGWKLWVTVVATLSAAIISSALFIYQLYKDKLSQEEGTDLLSYNFHETNSEEPANGEEHGKGITRYQIPVFKFASVSSATDDFSAVNKLGKGGFGDVYKGRLQSGEEVAVKRLSKIIHGKGSKEIRNEALLISELQHDNLVRLLGCCLEANENIIIYEYFPQKSLDGFLFETAKLDWENRRRIIDGIAAGLNYLHEHSRLQIIHGDLKATNILLDENMNPKISDIAMTRIFGANETLATNRMFGTFGYMAPEYASRGIVSNKSDVFSFGVLMLEILSGKKNNFRSANSLNLIGYVWDLWKWGRPLDLIDPKIGEPSSGSSIERYIHIALVCVQENDNDRPTMSDVELYLRNQTINIPPPKEPAVTKSRALA